MRRLDLIPNKDTFPLKKKKSSKLKTVVSTLIVNFNFRNSLQQIYLRKDNDKK